MEAKELRIGNRILFDGKITIVNTRMLAYINNANRLKNKIDLISFEPIPLSEEILLKCGFKENGNRKRDFYFRNYCIELFDNSCNFWIGDFNDIEINYLHQLQNLYWSLTGEELEINM